ncbi:MAG: outer membrane protein assembly factor BamE [Gemmatimonadetes bacterium]|nr:outer membrane protein assembly factor BamE [Gemmatimonadota bacterium]MBK7783156.1 outer membrane protein assembly factor BamE [Gemmatimonadota bacterium]MBK9068795.1 outer membrane protein assembly factor BamE [Gemmatimonadota bacterium]
MTERLGGSAARRLAGSAVGRCGLLLTLLAAGPATAQAPAVVSIKPGMTEAQVREAWGTPLTRRSHGIMSYLYYRNDCLQRCGTYDIVFLEQGQVIDAIVRDSRRRYDGISSSPAERVPERTVGP